MNWDRYAEALDRRSSEIVLTFADVDRGDPYLAGRVEHYRAQGKRVRLMPSGPPHEPPKAAPVAATAR